MTGVMLLLAGVLMVLSPVMCKKRCVEPSLEVREDKASIMVSATVRDIFSDYKHPGQYKAELEVKRIFKGNKLIPNYAGDYRYKRYIDRSKSYYGSGGEYDDTGAHVNSLEYLIRPKPIIMVSGFSDPKICDSKVKHFDTKIFLLTQLPEDDFGFSQGLYLNSSVLRITLHHLRRAESAVKNIPYVPTRSLKDSGPCKGKYCPYGGRCYEDTATNSAECRCMEGCPDVVDYVCGSDGVTYSSICRLGVASCTQQKRIRVVNKGSCGNPSNKIPRNPYIDVTDPCGNMDCSFGAHCVPSLDGLTARCQCPTTCHRYGDSVGSTPVCGSDGVDYPNQCEMRRASCSNMREVHVKYMGKCDPCHGFECDNSQVCQLDEYRKPVCRCKSMCTHAFSPVCGTNGRTYSNECMLGVEACKQRKDIRVLFNKVCSSGNNPCSTLTCREDEECHVDRNGKPQCTCPPPCEQIVNPVCGDNSVTYDNECTLIREACLHQIRVSVAHKGECNKNGPCANYRCRTGSLCVLENGLATCRCPTCSEIYEPVCGSDGVSYTNHCKLKAENCERQTNIRVVYTGVCNECANMECPHYATCEGDGRGGARCVCPSTCQQVVDEVCGTDGNTYRNECELRVTSCQQNQEITIASHGPCDTCLGIECKFGAVCELGRCVCPRNCPTLDAPVCGTDGRTYNNRCELRKQACATTSNINVLRVGPCDEDNIDDGSGSGDICDETTCRFGGICDFDYDGNSQCICGFNCDALRDPVCGSDGRSYGNECQLREAQCSRQVEITKLPSDQCESMDEEICDGKAPLINPRTGREYNCETGRETCPSESYCHRVGSRAKCCVEEENLIACSDTRYGCCPDGKTAAPGPNNAGCPSECHCHLLGSYSRTCDPNNNQCNCKPGVGGIRCDRCDPGYWGLPKIADGNTGCIPCGCNVFGSVRDDCEQMTGRCVCNSQISGNKCNLCPSGRVLGPMGCRKLQGPIRSCDDMTCRFGAVCSVRNNIATCDCHMTCHHDNSPISVCGTDGQTYSSHCELNLFSCRLQKYIQVAYEGSCSSELAVGDTTAPTPPRSRKTTRHVHDGSNVQRVTHKSDISPTDSTHVQYGLINDYCLSDEDCQVKRSMCRAGVCACHNGYSATDDNTHCSEMAFDVPAFAGHSYLSFRHLDRPNRDITIKLEFKTLNNDGLLLYNGQRDTGHGDFIAIIIKEQRVEFRFDLGSGPLILKSVQKIKLNNFHRVVARRFGQDGMLQIDEGPEVTGTSPGSLKSLNLGAALHLGFVPAMTEEIYNNVAVEVGLVGCVRSMEITIADHTKQYNLQYPGSTDISAGKGIGECGENPCISLPCQHGSTCMKTDPDSFQCHCQPGWVGETCSINESDSACTPSPCLAGGTCVPLPETNFACVCTEGRSGTTCENGQISDISVAQFHENSYMELPISTNVGESLAYEVWFLATKPTGVILYSSQEATNRGDFISLSLQERFLQFRYDLGGGIANITSSRKVPLNVWHRVNIARNNRRGSLIVNGGIPVEGQSKGNLNELNLGDNLYIGGHPSEYNPNSGIERGLTGAVQKVFENGKLLDNLVGRSTQLIGVTQYEGAPCPVRGNPCSNGGLCIPQLNEYECKCTSDYAGKHCDKHIENMDFNLPVAFDGHTYHKYYNMIDEKQKSEPSNKYSIRFRTNSASGLLLLLHKSSSVEGDYLAIAIANGRVECSFNLGKQSADVGLLILSSMERVDDGEWHKLLFDRLKRKGTLSIDGGDPVVALSEDGVTQLDTNGWLWIGGAHQVPSGLPQMYHEGFNGCISTVQINDVALNLVEDRQSHGSTEFCTKS